MTHQPTDSTRPAGSPTRRRPAQLVHPRSARVLAVISWLLAAGFLVMAALTRPFSWTAALLSLSGAALAWVLLWRPRIAMDERGVTIVNPVRTVDVPWQRVRRVGSRWSLEVESETGKHRAWAVGSSYRDPSRVEHSADVTGLGLIRPLDAGPGEGPVEPEIEMLPDLQSLAATVRGARDAHADALAGGHEEADPRPTTREVSPVAAVLLGLGVLVPLALLVL
ncbi:PH domain-containing protein [Kytococcus sp. Marseille-QA3725]